MVWTILRHDSKSFGGTNAITIEEYWDSLFDFILLAGTYVAVAVVVSYFTSHFLFRWRTAMVSGIIAFMIEPKNRGSGTTCARGHYKIQPDYGELRHKSN